MWDRGILRDDERLHARPVCVGCCCRCRCAGRGCQLRRRRCRHQRRRGRCQAVAVLSSSLLGSGARERREAVAKRARRLLSWWPRYRRPPGTAYRGTPRLNLFVPMYKILLALLQLSLSINVKQGTLHHKQLL